MYDSKCYEWCCGLSAMVRGKVALQAGVTKEKFELVASEL